MRGRSSRDDDDFFIWLACMVFLAWTVYLAVMERYGTMLVVGVVAGLAMGYLNYKRSGRMM